MSIRMLQLGVFGLLMLSVLISCKSLSPSKEERSPLKPIRMSENKVAIDVFFVRVPHHQEETLEDLWSELDEQSFPVPLRKSLAWNGIRVGIAGSYMPPSLSTMLSLEDKPVPTNIEKQDLTLDQIEQEPLVSRKYMHLGPKDYGLIEIGETLDELPLLMCENGEVFGKTYRQAQGFLSIRVKPNSDGSVELRVTPELQYGTPERKYEIKGGKAIFEVSRQKKIFGELGFTASILPGHWLVVGALPRSTKGLGYHMMTRDNGGKREHKVIAVRLSQTQHEGLFHAQDPLFFLDQSDDDSLEVGKTVEAQEVSAVEEDVDADEETLSDEEVSENKKGDQKGFWPPW